MARVPRKSVPTTRQRLLDAAASVFADKGYDGATTREIARQAEVNEVTLFRHFQSKENLLGAVLKGVFDGEGEAPLPAASNTLGGDAGHPPRPGLRSDLHRFARHYAKLLKRNILLIRTLLGEIHRHREHESRVLKGIFLPLKTDLVATLHAARERGVMRPEIDPTIAADLFSSMVFLDTLRRSLPIDPGYPADHYLETVVDVFVRGIKP